MILAIIFFVSLGIMILSFIGGVINMFTLVKGDHNSFNKVFFGHLLAITFMAISGLVSLVTGVAWIVTYVSENVQ